MGGTIFLLGDDDQLVEMNEQKYDSEALLQDLLTKYPKLLAGDQMDSVKPRRLLLVMPEAGIPAEQEGTDRFALDHLFLDQDGVPTLVEVKRSTDTRIRREVVGQMMDYAANAVAYWPVEEIRARFETTWQRDGGDPDQVLAEHIDDDDTEVFWEKVKINLKAGKLRLLFVADEIPAELRRIIEFLNGQMDPTEVLGIEIKQFIGDDGLKTLIPRVIGQTAEAGGRKGEPGRRWDKRRFDAALRKVASEEAVEITDSFLAFGEEVTGRKVDWGMGKERGSFTARLVADDERFSLFSFYTTGEFSVNLGWNEGKLGEQGSALSAEYRALVNDAMSLDFDERVWVHSWPMAKIELLAGDGAAPFKKLLQAYVAVVKAASSPDQN